MYISWFSSTELLATVVDNFFWGQYQGWETQVIEEEGSLTFLWQDSQREADYQGKEVLIVVSSSVKQKQIQKHLKVKVKVQKNKKLKSRQYQFINDIKLK